MAEEIFDYDVLMRFVFNGAEDLRPLIKNYSDDEMCPLLEGLPHRTEAELWDENTRGRTYAAMGRSILSQPGGIAFQILDAAGEMAGGLWVGNYASGSGMMAGATFGRIAGAHAATAALKS